MVMYFSSGSSRSYFFWLLLFWSLLKSRFHLFLSDMVWTTTKLANFFSFFSSVFGSFIKISSLSWLFSGPSAWMAWSMYQAKGLGMIHSPCSMLHASCIKTASKRILHSMLLQAIEHIVLYYWFYTQIRRKTWLYIGLNNLSLTKVRFFKYTIRLHIPLLFNKTIDRLNLLDLYFKKNPAYWRHGIWRLIRIVARI